MNETDFALDFTQLPKPRSIKILHEEAGSSRLVLDFGSIKSARACAKALGITLHDTDPDCHYVMVRQEGGTMRRGSLRVHVIGTEMVPRVQQDARLIVRAATEACIAAVAS